MILIKQLILILIASSIVMSINIRLFSSTKLDPTKCSDIKYGFEIEFRVKAKDGQIKGVNSEYGTCWIGDKSDGTKKLAWLKYNDVKLARIDSDFDGRLEFATEPFPVGSVNHQDVLRLTNIVLKKGFKALTTTAGVKFDKVHANWDDLLSCLKVSDETTLKDVQVSVGAPLSIFYYNEMIYEKKDQLINAKKIIDSISGITDKDKFQLMLIEYLNYAVRAHYDDNFSQSFAKNWVRWLPRMSLQSQKYDIYKKLEKNELQGSKISELKKHYDDVINDYSGWLTDDHFMDQKICKDGTKEYPIIVIESRFDYTDMNKFITNVLKEKDITNDQIKTQLTTKGGVEERLTKWWNNVNVAVKWT
jgi:hypothetical protein